MPWNAGAWFGSQLGVTVWMLVAGLGAAVHDLAAGLLVLLLCLVANLVGLGLWRRRRLSFRASMQVLVGVAGLCGLVTLLVLERAGLWTRIQVGGEVTAWPSLLIIVAVYGGLAFLLHFQRGRDGAAHQSASQRTPGREP